MFSYALPMTTITPCTFAIPHFVLIHNMSCYVYRNVRLGVYRSCSVSSSFIDRQLHAPDGQQQLEAVEPNRSGGRSLPPIGEHAEADCDDDSRNAPGSEAEPNAEKLHL